MTDDEYRIVLCDLPDGMNGCIVKKDDFCTILVDAKLTRENQQATVIHELKHMQLGHLDDLEKPVAEKEKEIKGRHLVE